MTELDVLNAIAALAVKVDAIKLKTDTIGAVSVTVMSPAAEDGTLTLYQGDSYSAAHSRSITMQVADSTHALILTDADCVVSLRGTEFTWEADSVTQTVAGWDIVFQPTVAKTGLLRFPGQAYKLVAEYDNLDPLVDDLVTLVTGRLLLVDDIPAITVADEPVV